MNNSENKGKYEFWKTSYKWLRQLGIEIDKNYCKEEMTTHPDYPALTSLIDLLDSGGMCYQAIKADESYIHDFNYPLLANIFTESEYIYIISTLDTWNKQKGITDYWTGVVLYAEKNAKWQSEQNNVYKANTIKRYVLIISLIISGILSMIVASIQLHNLLINLFGLLSLIGLVFSIIAVSAEIGYKNEIVKQVCNTISNNGCQKVLKSRYAKGILGITPADSSVIYFATQYVIYIYGSFYQFVLQSIILFAVIGLAVIPGSIYLQAIKIKEWCAICLGIASVLLIQIIITFNSPITIIFYQNVFYFIVIFFVLSMVYMPIKLLLKTNTDNKPKIAELKKWKSDVYLFICQWQNEQSVDTLTWQNDLVIGDKSAPLQLIFACNPYCPPCAQVHIEIDDLIFRYRSRLNVVFRFLSGNDIKKKPQLPQFWKLHLF